MAVVERPAPPAPAAISSSGPVERKTGTILVHARGFGFVEHEDGTASFVIPPDLNPFLTGDLVEADIVKGPDGRTNATKLTLKNRTRSELFGTVTHHGKHVFLRVDRFVSNTDWPLDLGAAGELSDGTACVASIAATGDRTVLIRTSGSAQEAALDRVVARHGIRSFYTKEQTAEAEAVAKSGPPPWGARRDLRALTTVTIDAPYSRDLDDALSAIPAASDGGLRVFVHIADVDAFVPEGSLLDQEARARATSVYLAGRVIPMVPHSLSDDGISLLEGKERPTLTVEMRIDPEGQVTSVDLYPSLIRSTKRLSYDGVDGFFAHNERTEVVPEVEETMRWLRTAAARLSAARATRGGMELVHEEAHVHLDPDTLEPTAIDARVSTESHKLVERLMVAANEAVARWLVERGLPGIFRVHDRPDARRVEALERFAAHFGLHTGFGGALTPRSLSAFEQQVQSSEAASSLSSLLTRVLGPARYTVFPSAHFGLAAPLYLHFTSPIRRYADLAVHRIVKRFLGGDRTQTANDPAYEALALTINAAAFAATKAEADRLRGLAAHYFQSRIGTELAGYVTSIKPFGLVVQLEGMGITGTIAQELLPGGPFHAGALEYELIGENGIRYRVGDALDVEVIGANVELGRIELALSQTS
jgi:ribonuclease R